MLLYMGNYRLSPNKNNYHGLPNKGEGNGKGEITLKQKQRLGNPNKSYETTSNKYKKPNNYYHDLVMNLLLKLALSYV